MIPATTQLYQSYPILCTMLKDRGYDVSHYTPLTLDHIEQQHLQHLRLPSSPDKPLSPIPPIIVAATEDSFPRALPFAKGSREWRELMTIANATPNAPTELTTAFHRRYPVLGTLMDELQQEEMWADVLRTPSSTNVRQTIEACLALYSVIAQPVAEVHFHQCFQPENLWGANSRDRKFMTEMQAMMTSMEATARTMFGERKQALQRLLTTLKWDDLAEPLADELVNVFKRSRTIICGYRTRSKASETLDKKYEVHCMELMAQHGVFVQLFNLKSLMYNVTAHEMVPRHEPLDLWHHGDDIARIQRTHNIQTLAKDLPVIPLNDPVAKFIGLRRGQLCRIVRVNDTGGTGVGYRWCK